MDNKIVKTLIGAVALSGAAVAGPVADTASGPSVTSGYNGGDFCSSLKKVGKLYKDKSNPFIQELSVFGRFQGQFAYLEGEDADGDKFNEKFDEARRVRFGSKIKFLNGFEAKANINLVDDGRPKGGSRDWGYKDFDQAKLSYKFKDILGLDSLKLTYGRHKIKMGHESHTSSKKIKTVERSAISNTIYNNRFTGLTAAFERGEFAATVGFLSLEKSDFVADWNEGNAIYFSTEADVFGNNVLFDALYNLDRDKDGTGDQFDIGYEWAASAAWERDFKGWNVMINTILGDHGDNSNTDREGLFWGVVVMPSKFIIEDKLEAVLQYQYQGSEEAEGIKANSRYISRIGDKTGDSRDLDTRGDQHHSIYAGLNYYFCGQNSKIMTGISYDRLSTPAGDADATSLWAAYRMYF